MRFITNADKRLRLDEVRINVGLFELDRLCQ